MNDLLTQKLEVSNTCGALIRKSRKQYISIAVLFSIISVIGMGSLIYKIYIDLQREFVPWKTSLNTKVYPCLMILYILLSLLQLYYYFKAIASQKTAVDRTDQEKFEASFKFYIYGNKLNIISLSLYLFIQLFPFVVVFINK